ncbi:MAG: pyridoxamine 5'-phosphate oxidase family protein [Aureispira sp.]
MAKLLEELTPVLEDFIRVQPLFFVATAKAEGRINLSPKGMDTFRILNANKIVWLNLTGSGNETAAHLAENPRMTIMFCAFEGKPLILRLYGSAKVYHERDEAYHQYIGLFEADAGARQIITMDIDIVQTSCGYAVPLMTYEEERTILRNWSRKQGKKKMEEYWKTTNTKSLDGDDTYIFENKG